MSSLQSTVAENVARICDRIAAAARRSGRTPQDVQLVAATKYVGVDEARAVVTAGCVDLGESRPQQLWSKAEVLGDLPVRWHMIGHLQRNKIRRTLPLVSLFHSIDSIRLLESLDAEAELLGRTTTVLLEVNVSGETNKHGFAPQEMPEVCAQLQRFPHVRVTGLMAMAGLEGDLDDARREFAVLRELRDKLSSELPDGVSLGELSMGMSGDYEIAIEEGATLVRIGSSLFERAEPTRAQTDERQGT